MDDLRAINQAGELVAFPGAEEISALRERAEEAEAEKERLKQLLDIELEEKRKLRATITRMTGERNAKKSLSPHYEAAERLYELWRRLLSPTAREFKGKRLENTLDRLEAGQPEELLARAIYGMAKYPYVTDEGRSAEGTTKQRHHDLEIVMRDEKTVHRFASYVEDEQKTATTFENFSTESVENMSTPTLSLVPEPYVPTSPVVSVPNWPVDCTKGCTHTRMLHGAWWLWQHAGMSGCPGCGYEVESKDGRRSEPYEWRRGT